MISRSEGGGSGSFDFFLLFLSAQLSCFLLFRPRILFSLSSSSSISFDLIGLLYAVPLALDSIRRDKQPVHFLVDFSLQGMDFDSIHPDGGMLFSPLFSLMISRLLPALVACALFDLMEREKNGLTFVPIDRTVRSHPLSALAVLMRSESGAMADEIQFDSIRSAVQIRQEEEEKIKTIALTTTALTPTTESYCWADRSDRLVDDARAL